MSSIDITILTDSSSVAPATVTPHIRNILYEDELVRTALEKRGLRVHRINWDAEEMDWSDTRYILFRTTWDYFNRYPEFAQWLEKRREETAMINPYELIRWNLDKHYLAELSTLGINIPPTRYIETGDGCTLKDIAAESGWREIVLKPVISGGGRHTYRFLPRETETYESIFRSLLNTESLIIQEFQKQVVNRGEVAFMFFDGEFTHAILKKAKRGEFRVQDDFGGTVHRYRASSEEIDWAVSVIHACNPLPVYARVDAIWDNNNRLALAELELIEPELWFRHHPEATENLANAVLKYIT